MKQSKVIQLVLFVVEIFKMTKLTEMDLPKGGIPMFFCEICKVWVPEENKHNKKRHNGRRS